MLVRMLTHITGFRDGEEWPPVGGTLEVSDHEGRDLIAAGYAAETTEEAAHDASSVEDSDEGSGTDTGGDSAADDDDEETDDDSDAAAGTVAEVLERVGDDRELARVALDAENARPRPRVSLVEGLAQVLAPPGD